jgi:hypothetical protein
MEKSIWFIVRFLVQTHFVGLPLSLLQHAICLDIQLHFISKTYNIQIQLMSFPPTLQWPRIEGLIKHQLTLISIKNIIRYSSTDVHVWRVCGGL